MRAQCVVTTASMSTPPSRARSRRKPYGAADSEVPTNAPQAGVRARRELCGTQRAVSPRWEKESGAPRS